MRDKDIVALLTVLAYALIILPITWIKFVGVAIIFLFSPGFFVVGCIYRDMNEEEKILLAFGVSLGISGAFALILAVFSMLSPLNILLVLGLISIIGYFISASSDLPKLEISVPDKFTALMLSLMLVSIGIWFSVELHTTQYREIDIAIENWPHNATVNSTLKFNISVKNQNYGNAQCKIVFLLNKNEIKEEKFSLNSGELKNLHFSAISNHSGKNFAKFILYVDAKYYTDVHLYFILKNETKKSQL